MVKEKFKIKAKNGLGSRPSVALVHEANKFDSNLEINYDNDIANLKSIMNVMALVIGHGDEFEVLADGKDEVEALKGIKEVLIHNEMI